MLKVYYNDSEPFVAAWLRNLIAAAELPDGEVDERPIQEVQAGDLKGFRQCHFFAGIGGWAYALRLAGWPDDRPIWTGSCPCQPFSTAGQRQSHRDDRHLWPAWHRLIAECRPVVLFGEQVSGAAGLGWLDAVSADLEAEGYSVGTCLLGAHSVGAPHRRQRLYFVADAERGAAERHRHAVGCSPSGDQGGAEERQRLRPDAGDGEPIGELADANGGDPGDGGLQRGREHGQQPQDGGAGELAQPQPDGREGSIRPQEQGAFGREHQPFGGRGSIPWADCAWLLCRDGKARPVEPGTFPLAHGLPANMGCDGTSETSPFRVIRDPETGRSIGQAPWRIGMLRAYGNAIVPQTAAAFVRAAMECLP